MHRQVHAPRVFQTTSYLEVCWRPGNEQLQPAWTSWGVSGPTDQKLAAQRAEQRRWRVTQPGLPLVQACQRSKVSPATCECRLCKSAATPWHGSIARARVSGNSTPLCGTEGASTCLAAGTATQSLPKHLQGPAAGQQLRFVLWPGLVQAFLVSILAPSRMLSSWLVMEPQVLCVPLKRKWVWFVVRQTGLAGQFSRWTGCAWNRD